jgi:hypothetical protein
MSVGIQTDDAAAFEFNTDRMFLCETKIIID